MFAAENLVFGCQMFWKDTPSLLGCMCFMIYVSVLLYYWFKLVLGMCRHTDMDDLQRADIRAGDRQADIAGSTAQIDSAFDYCAEHFVGLGNSQATHRTVAQALELSEQVIADIVAGRRVPIEVLEKIPVPGSVHRETAATDLQFEWREELSSIVGCEQNVDGLHKNLSNIEDYLTDSRIKAYFAYLRIRPRHLASQLFKVNVDHDVLKAVGNVAAKFQWGYCRFSATAIFMLLVPTHLRSTLEELLITLLGRLSDDKYILYAKRLHDSVKVSRSQHQRQYNDILQHRGSWQGTLQSRSYSFPSHVENQA